MSYTLNKSDGTVLVTVEDGTTNTAASSLTFVGQNYVGYGEVLQENLVALLENFAKTSAPRNPIVGQLWWDKSSSLLKVRVDSGTWKTLASSTASLSAPGNASIGDFWFDTSVDQVKVYAGNGWIIVGPPYQRGQDTIANGFTITDTLTNTHDTMSFWVDGSIRAIFNPDLDFTPASIVPGFSTIRQGFNLASTLSGTTYHGTAQNAQTLQSLEPSAFLRSNQNETIGGNLLINSDQGLWIGTGGKFRITVDSLTGAATLRNRINNAGIIIAGTVDNTQVNYVTSDPTTGLLNVAGNPTASLGIATKNYVDTNITSVTSVLRNDIDSNVVSINATLGSLITEINNLNTYALNLNASKAAIASPEFIGVPKAATLPITASNTALATTAFVQNVLQASPNLSGVPTAPTLSVFTSNTAIATTEFVHRMFPLGSVIMWYGSIITIPAGWALCDGSNGTPDLRDRFVIGAGNNYAVNARGGSKDAIVVSHTHGVNDPGHVHTYTRAALNTPFKQGQSNAVTNSLPTDNTGNAKTGITVVAAGVDGTNANLPPYYALCFIMKVV
jgi:hypothetical protein